MHIHVWSTKGTFLNMWFNIELNLLLFEWITDPTSFYKDCCLPYKSSYLAQSKDFTCAICTQISEKSLQDNSWKCWCGRQQPTHTHEHGKEKSLTFRQFMRMHSNIWLQFHLGFCLTHLMVHIFHSQFLLITFYFEQILVKV